MGVRKFCIVCDFEIVDALSTESYFGSNSWWKFRLIFPSIKKSDTVILLVVRIRPQYYECLFRKLLKFAIHVLHWFIGVYIVLILWYMCDCKTYFKILFWFWKIEGEILSPACDHENSFYDFYKEIVNVFWTGALRMSTKSC